nr:hypothetical protein [uncultured Brevundimonas sp.]
MTVVAGLSNIAAKMGVSRRTAKRLARTGEVSMQLVDRHRFASRQAIDGFRRERHAVSAWEDEGGALRGPLPSDRSFPSPKKEAQ